MVSRKAALCVLLAAMTATTLLLVPDKTEATPPTITDVLYTPKYPQIGDTINVTARVEDIHAITLISLQFCRLPNNVCTAHDMFDLEGDHIYNTSVTADSGDTGGKFVVAVVDEVSDYNSSIPVYIQYALNITASLTSDRGEAYPGHPLNLTVDAYYSDNTSAPCEYCDVDISLNDSTQHWTGKMDDQGNFTVELDAPLAIGSYVYTVTVTNRSLSDSAAVNLLVLTEPMPDLVVTSSDIVWFPLSPNVGDSVTANITIKNLGTLDATFRVLVILDESNVLLNISVTLGAGNVTHVLVSWDALPGTQTLAVVLDPENVVREASEGNNNGSATIVGLVIKVDGPDYTLYIVGALIIFAAVATITVIVVRRGKPEQPLQ